MTTVKISDLSVGDWVKVKDDTYKVMGITMFAEFDLCNSSVAFRETLDNIEPIPITAEILEKNGFERSTSQFIVYHTDKVWISYDKPSETWSVTMYINDFTSSLHANILHIHQLQHALRLAGVEKEINL